MQKVRSGSTFESRLLELEKQSQQKLFHYTNLRLVKETDNRAKGTSLDYQIGGAVC